MSYLRPSIGALALLAALATPAFAVGPTSTLYIMNYAEFGTSTGLDLVQGNTATSFTTGLNLDINIAVYGDVRTMGYSTTDVGARFSLAGAPLAGGPYTNTIAASQLHDGTTDGNYNYTVNFTTGDVLQYDRNWTTPTVLFNALATMPNAGWITMDVTDGSFWLSEWGGPDRVEHRTHTGALLSTFNSGITGAVANADLALDPIDGTLWMADTSYRLYQFNQSGAQLQNLTYGALTGQPYGMEFDTTLPTPEPASLSLLALATLPLLVRRDPKKNV